MRIRTLHDLEDDIQEMVNALYAGKELPPIHCVDMGEYTKAIEGTHRLLAYQIANKVPNIIMVDYEENKDKSILEIIGDTDGDSNFTPYDTLAEVLDKFETVGVDLEFGEDY